MNPQTVVAYSLGILLFFYSGKAPTRLFVVLSVTVKPFDDVVAGYTSRNSDYKRYESADIVTKWLLVELIFLINAVTFRKLIFVSRKRNVSCN